MVFGISRIDPISELERKLASYVGTDYAICTSMGRTALFSLLKSIAVRTGDEVIVPAYICEVVPNAVLKAGATPIFVDINSENYRISISHLTSLISKNTKAIIISHTFGYPEDMDSIKSILNKIDKKIYLIEDAAHALGALYKGKKVGGFGDAAIFSFTKNMANFGGGAITTNDPQIEANARKIIKGSRSLAINYALFFGMLSFFDQHRVNSIVYDSLMKLLERLPQIMGNAVDSYSEELKIPARKQMSRIQAHIALIQLKEIDYSNEQRDRNRRILDEMLAKNSKILPLKYDYNSMKSTATWYVIRLKCSEDMTEILENCRKQKLYFSAFWDPIPIEQRKYNDSENIYVISNAVAAAKSTIVFKMGDKLSRRSVESICDVFREVVIDKKTY